MKSTDNKQVYCRICLAQKPEDQPDKSYKDIFKVWSSNYYTLYQNTTSIAKELSKLADVEISEKDGFSRFICKVCYQKLSVTLKFIYDVRTTAGKLTQTNKCDTEPVIVTRPEPDNSLKLENEKPIENNIWPLKTEKPIENETWPQPIEWDKNVNEVLKSPFDVEIKQEVMSEEEMDLHEYEGLGSPELHIKQEPEDEAMPIQITVNGTITEDQHKSMTSMMNGDDSYENIEYLVKEEPWNEDIPSDLQPECLLCAKDFRTLQGLRAHVLAEHNYKGVKRKAYTSQSPMKVRVTAGPAPADSNPYRCATCMRVFTTSTDLLVHEVCHNKHCCYLCETKCDSFQQLVAHRRRCKVGKNVVVKPRTLNDAMRERKHIHIKRAQELTLECLTCNIVFKDVFYLKLHNSVEHANDLDENYDSDESTDPEETMTETETEINKNIPSRNVDTISTKKDSELDNNAKTIVKNNSLNAKTSDGKSKENNIITTEKQNNDSTKEHETEQTTKLRMESIIKQKENEQEKNAEIDKPTEIEIKVDSIFEYTVEKQPVPINSENKVLEDDKEPQKIDGDVTVKVERDMQDTANEKDDTDRKVNNDATEILIEIDFNKTYKSEEQSTSTVKTHEDNGENKDFEQNKYQIKDNEIDLEQMESKIDTQSVDKDIEHVRVTGTPERKPAKLLIVDMQEISESESGNQSSTDDVDSEHCQKIYSEQNSEKNDEPVNKLENNINKRTEDLADKEIRVKDLNKTYKSEEQSTSTVKTHEDNVQNKDFEQNKYQIKDNEKDLEQMQSKLDTQSVDKHIEDVRVTCSACEK